MSIDKSTKSSSNSNSSIRIENKAGGNESREAPLMIASGNVYLRLCQTLHIHTRLVFILKILLCQEVLIMVLEVVVVGLTIIIKVVPLATIQQSHQSMVDPPLSSHLPMLLISGEEFHKEP